MSRYQHTYCYYSEHHIIVSRQQESIGWFYVFAWASHWWTLSAYCAQSC